MAPENFIHFASLKSRGLILLGLKKVTSFDEIIIKYRDSTAHILHVFFFDKNIFDIKCNLRNKYYKKRGTILYFLQFLDL